MSKTIKRLFDEKLQLHYFFEAHLRARKHKMYKKEILKFELDLETNLINLINEIKQQRYCIGKYRSFIVYEPKERLIKSLPYRDRVVHQWYVEEFIKPYILPRFIKDTYACIEGRGTLASVLQLQKYMRIMKRRYGTYYIVKCDIKKYFYSIDKQLLYQLMNKYITDQKLLAFTRVLIFDDKENLGIPIGNYTSQYFANIYLNELDHYMKETCHLKYYVRYMDDFIFLVATKEEASKYKQMAEQFVQEHLHLKFNHKSRYFPNAMGVEFCGYKIYETHRLLKRRSKDTIKKNVKRWNHEYVEGSIDVPMVQMQWNSWVAHAEKCDSYLFRQRMLQRIDFKDDPEFSFIIERLNQEKA